MLSVVTFRSGQWPYRLAYFGALTSYGVVVYKSHGVSLGLCVCPFVLYHSLQYYLAQIPKVNAAYMQRLIMDENVQYMVLAFYWCLSKPMTGKSNHYEGNKDILADRAQKLVSVHSSSVAVTLIPYATFSLFHSLNYVRSNIIPTVFPTAQGASGASSWQAKTQQRLKAWQDSNYEPAMRFVAQIEVIGIMGRLLLGIFQ